MYNLFNALTHVRIISDSFEMEEEPGGSPIFKKRKKFFTGAEIIEKLKENDHKIRKVCQDITEELCPIDLNEKESDEADDILQKLSDIAQSLSGKVSRLSRALKERKFRHCLEKLDEKVVSCSQFSVLQSDESETNFDSQDCDPDFIATEEVSDEDSMKESKTCSAAYKKKPLDSEMTGKTRKRRVEDEHKFIKNMALKEGVSTSKLLGYILYLENYHEGDRNLASAGWRIFMGEKLSTKHEASVEESLWLIERTCMSQALYLEVRLRFLDRFVLPPVMKIVAENKLHRPALAEYKNGVKAPLVSCLSLTLTDRLRVVDLSSLNTESQLKVRFQFTWGLDGSGDHSNFNQISKAHFSTKSAMSVCFSVTEVKIEDEAGNQVQWSSSEKGSNRPQNVCPLSIYPEKEEKELLTEFVPLVEEEIRDVVKNGVSAEIGGDEVDAICENSELSMIDGKMIAKLLQVEGAFCTMCTNSQIACHEKDVIETGFLIDRSITSVKDLALSLMDHDTGEIPRQKGDYTVRQGITDQPITSSEITRNIPVCHAKIRSFSWFIDFLIRLLSHKKWWSVQKPVKYTEEDKEMYKKVTALVKEIMMEKLGVNIGNPGDLIEGNAFKSFSSDFARDIIGNLVEEKDATVIKEIHLGLCTAVKVINSQKRKVNIEKLRDLTKDVNLKIVEHFPWAIISPSVHRILGHAWERIQYNDGYGLGNVREEGLEALNKWIRRFR